MVRGLHVRSIPVIAGAVDLGTNSTRMLVVDTASGGVLDRRMTITRLGQGVEQTGALADDAVQRVIDCLSDYRSAMDAHGVKQVRAVATSACRDAGNRDEFFERVETTLATPPELLSGDEEGRLAFAGATAVLDPADGPFLVVDIGGGSTEFVYGHSVAEAGLSCDIGCVRLTEQYVRHDPPLAEELADCLAICEAHLDDVARRIPQAAAARTLVGLAGTVSTAAAVEIGLACYDRERIHHFRLSKSAVEDVYRTLATEPLADRIHNPGLAPERAEVIVGGLSILVRVMRYFGFEECLVSESDILDGIIAELADQR